MAPSGGQGYAQIVISLILPSSRYTPLMRNREKQDVDCWAKIISTTITKCISKREDKVAKIEHSDSTVVFPNVTQDDHDT